MSTVYRCDRCSREFKQPDGNLGSVTFRSAGAPLQHVNREVEVCIRCLSDLQKAAEPLPTDAHSDVGWLQARVRGLEGSLQAIATAQKTLENAVDDHVGGGSVDACRFQLREAIKTGEGIL